LPKVLVCPSANLEACRGYRYRIADELRCSLWRRGSSTVRLSEGPLEVAVAEPGFTADEFSLCTSCLGGDCCKSALCGHEGPDPPLTFVVFELCRPIYLSVKARMKRTDLPEAAFKSKVKVLRCVRLDDPVLAL
jgi:hypothetical protein